MPIFTQQLRNLEAATPQEAVKIMAGHLRYIQEQLEYTLMNLDSSNIIAIDTDETELGGGTVDVLNGLEKAVGGLGQTVSGLSSSVSGHGRTISELQQGLGSLSGTVSSQDQEIMILNNTLDNHGNRIRSLENTMPGKLTASPAAAQGALAAEADLAAVIAAWNGLVAAMKAAGLMNT